MNATCFVSVLGIAIGLTAVGCGDDTGNAASTTTGGTGAAGAAGGSGGTGAVGGAGGSGGDGNSGGNEASGGGGMGGGTTCSAALEQALSPIDLVSEGEVATLSDENGTITLFADGSAGGISNQGTQPWIYVSLSSAERVDVTDNTSYDSAAWDIAFKRPIIRTNSGDGGPGNGGAALLDGASFDAVTLQDAQAAMLQTEDWFDDECVLYTDATGAISTSFDGWYDYADMVLSPHAGVWVLAGGDGALYKVEFLDYYSNPDGSSGQSGGRYRLRYAAL